MLQNWALLLCSRVSQTIIVKETCSAEERVEVMAKTTIPPT